MRSVLLIFGVLIAVIAMTTALPIDQTEIDPEEQGDYFEGDMILDNDQMEAIINPRGRNIIRQERYRWKNAQVYYEFEDVFNDAQKTQVFKALEAIEQNSCIKFLPKEAGTVDYIKITGNPTGCHSRVGRAQGEQRLNLAPNEPGKGCFNLFKIAHEFMHALGFYHQQSAPNREQYVRIMRNNIKEGKLKNFKKKNLPILRH